MSEDKQALLDEWLKDRPQVIKDIAKRLPPWKTYVLKGQEDLGTYHPLAYSEDGTIRCEKTDWLGMTYQVFGMKPEDLIEAPEALTNKERE